MGGWDLFKPDPEEPLEALGSTDTLGRVDAGGVGADTGVEADASPTPPGDGIVDGSFWLTILEVILWDACSSRWRPLGVCRRHSSIRDLHASEWFASWLTGNPYFLVSHPRQPAV